MKRFFQKDRGWSPPKMPVGGSPERQRGQLVNHLAGQAHTGQLASRVMPHVHSFQNLRGDAQRDALPATYLALEALLTDSEIGISSDVVGLRKMVQEHFPSLLESDDFAVIFQAHERQGLWLSHRLLAGVCRSAHQLMRGEERRPLLALLQWLQRQRPDSEALAALSIAPEANPDDPGALRAAGAGVRTLLAGRLGEFGAQRLFEQQFDALWDVYGGLEGASVLGGFLPLASLKRGRMDSLSSETLRPLLLETFDELERAKKEGERTAARLDGALSESERMTLASDEATAQLQVIMDVANDGLIVIDEQGAILMVNRAAETL
ncbi:MAG: PAS domain-containing protein, partial [Gammaproteobacteria bacterium]